MDLTPRTVVPTAVGRKRKRPVMAMVVLVVVLLAGGVMVAKFLTSAINYYCNVDEIGVKSGCDVGRSIRIQGVVEKGSVGKSGDHIDSFVMSFNGKKMTVNVGSQPTGLFQECIPVVVAGRAEQSADGVVFAGNEIIIKHDNNYDAANKTRLAASNQEAAACSQKG